MSELFIYVVLGIAVMLGAEALYHAVRYSGEKRRTHLKRRLRSLGEPGGVSLLKERRVARSPGLDRLLRQLPFTESLEQLLLETDLTWNVAGMLGLGLLIGILLAVAALIFLPPLKLLALLAIPLGFVFPILFAVYGRSRRSKQLSVQVPDALDMMARSLQAGHGISAGFKLVATEMPPPIAVEFGRCFEEHNLGIEFKEAVTNMTYRVPDNLDLKLFAVSIMIQHETGGNLVEILEQISTTIRERYKFYGKLRALTAEGKASASILGLLPFLFAVGITILSPGYLSPLLTEPVGRLILLFGVSFWLIGMFWIRSLADIDY